MLTPKNQPQLYPLSGLVTSVDTARKVCKVITDDGRMHRGIAWKYAAGDYGRGGESWTPSPFDRVLLEPLNGILVITSSSGSSFSKREHLSFLGTKYEVDSKDFFHRYNLTHGSAKITRGGNYHEDQIPGDRFLTSPSGSLLGVLAGGSILAKASPGAQIYISRLDDLVRIVGRNYEVFSDASKQVDANVSGSLYRYMECYDTVGGSAEEEPVYLEALGNTLAALKYKGDPAGPNEAEVLPDAIVRLQRVRTDKETRWSRTIDRDGTSTERSLSETAEEFSETNLKNDLWSVLVVDNTGRCLFQGRVEEASILVEKDGTSSSLSLGGNGDTRLKSSNKVYVETEKAYVRADKIDLGKADRELQRVVLGDTLAQWFDTFSQAYLAHTHTGNLGAPTSPPIAPADFTNVKTSGSAYSEFNRTQ